MQLIKQVSKNEGTVYQQWRDSDNHFTLFLYSSSQAERQGTIDYIQSWIDAKIKVMGSTLQGDEKQEYEKLLNLFGDNQKDKPVEEE